MCVSLSKQRSHMPGIDNPNFYFQTIRYGWNNKTPLSVLTDFEEMRVLDCRYKPDISTALGHAVLKYHYADYADKEKFRTIYYLFSREAVLNGSIESFAKGNAEAVAQAYA